MGMHWTQLGAGIGSTTGRFDVEAGAASARTWSAYAVLPPYMPSVPRRSS
ncbi:MAG TPA: hypothetical protein VLW53_11875 [Candidatus Eisenbacteria bacterium]|nr:hypothetical protein [Candidatus Eisenbacteria bacterium]